MQSYYGSSPAAKRFEVTQCQRKLQLPKGIVRTWNTQILYRGCGQLQEESFRRAALVDLSDGMKITGTGSYQHRQAQRGFEPLTNSPGYHFFGLPQAHKGEQNDIDLGMAQTKKGTQGPGHIPRVTLPGG